MLSYNWISYSTIAHYHMISIKFATLCDWGVCQSGSQDYLLSYPKKNESWIESSSPANQKEVYASSFLSYFYPIQIIYRSDFYQRPALFKYRELS